MSLSDRKPPPADLPDELLELAAERLVAAPPGDRTRALDHLVRAHPEFAVPLRRLAGDLAGAERLLDDGFAAAPEPVHSVGPYRVLGVIGEGAFGVVYRCAQEVPVRREVAVKVLRPGAGDRHTLARFEAERQVLARLSHPAIAQVFDAGVLPDGRPWFAMEYVRGLPIAGYCDTHCLGVDARIALFLRLCQGVQHAHAQGIVHRDLKPPNILVYEQDGHPQPKIIDFGIAKALRPTEADEKFRTETGRVIGTPGYMSPEQSGGGSGDLDARADVFSLGVVLYELLTGELPWGRRPQTTDSDPPRPSQRVATDNTGSVARQRATPPRKLASRLRGDLDWIVLRALARERESRYASVQELAADLMRHVRGEPVLAGPPALRYRLRKFARRHRLALAAGGTVLVVLAVGLWLSLGFRAAALNWAADVEAAAAALLARAKDQSIVQARQSEGVRKALAQDALGIYEKLLRERPEEPRLREGRARALWTLSQVHWLVGEHARSEAAAQEATAEAEALLAADPDHLGYRGILGNSLRNVGRAASCGGRMDVARAAFARAVRELEQCHARSPASYADLLVRALLEWASALPLTELDASADALRRAVAIQEGTVQEQRSAAARIDLLDVLVALGTLLTMQDQLQEAAQTLRRADDLLGQTPEAGPGQVCGVLNASATLAARRGNPRVAIQRLTKAIAAAERWSEQEPNWQEPRKRLLELRGALVQQHGTLGDEAAVAAASRAAIATAEALAARFPEDPLARGQVAGHLSALATALLPLCRRNLLVEAETCARRAIQLSDTVSDSVDLRMRARARWLFRCHLGFVLDARGADARACWEEASQAVEAWQAQFGISAEDGNAYVESALRIARHRLEAGQDQRAGETLDRIAAVLREHEAAMVGPPPLAAEAHRLRALLLVKGRQWAPAAAECEKAGSAGTQWRCLLAAADGMHAVWRAARTGGEEPARVAGYRDRAIELHRTLLAALQELLAASPGDDWLALPDGQSSVRLAEMLLDRGEREPARELLHAALPALTEMRDRVHADRWDEALYLEGKALAAK